MKDDEQEGAGDAPAPMLTADMEALRRLLPRETVVTPETLAVALEWLLEQIKRYVAAYAERQKENNRVVPEYATQHQLAVYFGVSDTTMMRILRPLVAAGKVRLWRAPGEERKCYPRYSISDVKKASSAHDERE